MRELHEANRRSWNAATRAHNSHKGDQAAHLRAGATTLFPEEVELLGAIAGKRLLHVSCNSGQDTLSLALRHGAVVTGVDISDEAIDVARGLARDIPVPDARFERADIYDWLPEAAARGERFDVVFGSYGVIGWLTDLDAWARGIAAVMAPGARFVLVEFHPVAWMFDEELRHVYPYSSHGAPIDEGGIGVGDYVARSGAALVPWGFEEGVVGFTNPNPCHGFGWGLGDLLGALLGAGLRIDAVREWEHANGCRIFRSMTERPGRRFVVEGAPSFPLMLGVAARRM